MISVGSGDATVGSGLDAVGSGLATVDSGYGSATPTVAVALRGGDSCVAVAVGKQIGH